MTNYIPLLEMTNYFAKSLKIGKNVYIGTAAAFTNNNNRMSPKMIGVVVGDGAIVGGM